MGAARHTESGVGAALCHRRGSLVFKWYFMESCSHGGLKLGPGERMTPLQLGHIFGFVVGLPVLPEAPEDLNPALTQTAQCARVAVAFGSLVLVVGVGPGTGQPAAVGPQMDRGAQHLVAGPAQAALFH